MLNERTTHANYNITVIHTLPGLSPSVNEEVRYEVTLVLLSFGLNYQTLSIGIVNMKLLNTFPGLCDYQTISCSNFFVDMKYVQRASQMTKLDIRM